ncbi:MAG: hypothetical protein WC668_01110 [Patescibacteria group bacterium]|jgi:tRNA A58 N-methylase Trm61
MLIYLLLFAYLIFLAICAVFGISVLVGLVMTKGVPFVSTPRYDLEKICEAAELKPGEKIFDLGCGKANLLTVAAKKFGASGTGYELSLWPYFWGWWRVKILRADVRLKMQDFLRADLSQADVVFCYLFPEVMDKLENKFKKELRPGARVVSYTFKLPNIQPAKTVKGREDKNLFDRCLRTKGIIYVYQF